MKNFDNDFQYKEKLIDQLREMVEQQRKGGPYINTDILLKVKIEMGAKELKYTLNHQLHNHYNDCVTNESVYDSYQMILKQKREIETTFQKVKNFHDKLLTSHHNDKPIDLDRNTLESPMIDLDIG